MQLIEVKQVELEITSYCNAVCPGCPRTIINNNPNKILPLNNITFLNLKNWMPCVKILNPKNWKFSGNLGDPIVNPDLLNIVEFLSKNYGNNIHIHTNGGVRKYNFWKELAKLSKYGKENNKFNLIVRWAIDGLENTNHIYRVNVNFDSVMQNLETYLKWGGLAEWHFICFEHNEHQLNEIKDLAKSKNMKFVLRKATRNYQPYVNKENIVINNSVKIQHNKTDIYKKLSNAYKGVINKSNSTCSKKYKEILDTYSTSVKCMHLKQKQIFIASNQTLWPCCMLWDELIQKNNKMENSLPINTNWNNLEKFTMQEILTSDYYKNIDQLWNKNNSKFTPRCVKSCAEQGKFATQFVNL